jgi:ABC-type transporter Mla maintaining outer membrane lipid asymmetry permease subunit MlaE
LIHVPPAEVSRIALLAFVVVGVVLALVGSGDLASFGRGFAVGAGAALVLSRTRRPVEPAEPADTTDAANPAREAGP